MADAGDDPALAAEPYGSRDLEAQLDAARLKVAEALNALERLRPTVGESLAAEIDEVLRAADPSWNASSPRCRRSPPALVKTRRHGDYRLAQVLVAKGDVMLVDFEGEARRPLAQRRAKGLALADVADMLRSFDHAAWTSVFRFTEADPVAFDQLLAAALAWRDAARAAFLEEYRCGDRRLRQLARRCGGRAAAPAMSPGAPVRGGDARGG